MLTVVLPVAMVGLVVLAYQGAGDFEGQRWIVLVPLAALSLLAPILIVLTSYQIGLWHFLSVRASGVLLFAPVTAILLLFSIEPLQELFGGISFGYSPLAWIYTVLLWLLSLPGLVVMASVLGMSLRLARVRPPLDPVVRGWRPWPTNLLAPALRTLCVPSFVVALPRGQFLSTFLFVMIVLLLALHTALVLGPAMSAPAILTSVVSSLLGGTHTNPPYDAMSATVGAAITARSSEASRPLLSLEQTLPVVPFVLTLALLLRRGGVEPEAGGAIVASCSPTSRRYLSDDHAARHASADTVSEVVQGRKAPARATGEIATRKGAQIERFETGLSMKSFWMPQALLVQLSRSVYQPRRRRHWVRRGSMPTMLDGKRRFVDWFNKAAPSSFAWKTVKVCCGN